MINLDYLLSRTADFEKSIIFPFFVCTICGFLLSVFFLHYKQYDNMVLQIEQNIQSEGRKPNTCVFFFHIIYSFTAVFIKNKLIMANI